MNLAENAARRPLASLVPAVAAGRTGLAARLPIYAVCTALALIVNYALGKEMAWDSLNYHLYAGFSAIHDRFAQDYFAAGPQAYANPYAYAPFYALVSSGASALLIASILAAAHSLILWLTFEFGLLICPSADAGRRTLFAACATGLAAINPVLLQQIGSSFADITTAELALGGWLLLTSAQRNPGAVRVVLGAVLLGAATALKQTNAVHAMAAFTLVVLIPGSMQTRFRHTATYVLALGASFVLISAPWSLRLAHRFGNPFFPLLNNVFRSPEFTSEPLRHLRFIPSSFAEALWRPFAMLDPQRMVHEELSAPDMRYAVLLALLAVLVLKWLGSRVARPRSGTTADSVSIVDAPVAFRLGCAFILDWTVWLAVSGNSRYFLPMACVCGVLLAALLFQVCAGHGKVRNSLLLAIFAAQATQLWMGTELRWNGRSWDGGKWFETQVPERLRTEPSLYLSIGTQSNSFVAPDLAPQSGLINFSGGYPLAATGPNGAHVQALIRQYMPRVRLLTRGERIYADSERRSPSESDVNGALKRFGLRADLSDCTQIGVRGLPPELEFTFGSVPRRAPDSPDTTYLVSCRLVPSGVSASAELAVQRQADLVLDRLEDACPALFQPRRLPTDVRGRTARRLYINTDLIAWVSYGRVKFFDPIRGEDMVALGTERDWLEARLPRLVCARRDGRYFARVVNSGTRGAHGTTGAAAPPR